MSATEMIASFVTDQEFLTGQHVAGLVCFFCVQVLNSREGCRSPPWPVPITGNDFRGKRTVLQIADEVWGDVLEQEDGRWCGVLGLHDHFVTGEIRRSGNEIGLTVYDPLGIRPKDLCVQATKKPMYVGDINYLEHVLEVQAQARKLSHRRTVLASVGWQRDPELGSSRVNSCGVFAALSTSQLLSGRPVVKPNSAELDFGRLIARLCGDEREVHGVKPVLEEFARKAGWTGSNPWERWCAVVGRDVNVL